MALTVDYSVTPFLITVPKSDLTLESGTQYKLTVDEFWILLRDFTDEQTTMAQPKLYSRIPATSSTPSITTIDLAYYAIEFEDGLYSVNIISGNTNIREAEVKNQVSVNTNNTTGFIDPTYLEYSTFGGGVSVDALSGITGTAYPKGTPSQPVNNFTDALIIAEARGFKTFMVAGDATIDGGNDFTDYNFIGHGQNLSTFTLGNAAVLVNCSFFDAQLTGILDGDTNVEECIINNLTFVSGVLERCLLSEGTTVLGGGSTAYFIDCKSGVTGAGTHIIDCGGSGQPLAIRNYNGGIKIINKTGAEAISIDLNSGQVILSNTTVTNGTIVVRGIGKLVDESGDRIISGNFNGATIINELLDSGGIAEAVWDERLTGATHNVPTSAGRRLRESSSQVITTGTAIGSGTGSNQIQLNGDASTIDNAYDPASISIVGGTGYGQSRGIIQYEGSIKLATVDRNWKVNPDNTSEYVIFGWVGREHVNEGLAQAGTANTITLNSLASSSNDVYIGQLVFIRSGTGDDQVGNVIAYDGTTKIATVAHNWAVIPDSTSGYAMLPLQSSNDLVAEAVWTYTRP